MLFNRSEWADRGWRAYGRHGGDADHALGALVSDFARLDVLERFGGVYLDLDALALSPALMRLPDGLALESSVDVCPPGQRRMPGLLSCQDGKARRRRPAPSPAAR
jgi:hypothetical protein